MFELPADAEALAEYLSTLEQAVAGLSVERDSLSQMAAAEAIMREAAARLGDLAGQLAATAGEIHEDVSWLRRCLAPNIIAEIAPLMTWSGFKTLPDFYTMLELRGLLPSGLSQAELAFWFSTAQAPIAEHIARTTGCEVLWVQEGNTWTLSFIERGWEDRLLPSEGASGMRVSTAMGHVAEAERQLLPAAPTATVAPAPPAEAPPKSDILAPPPAPPVPPKASPTPPAAPREAKRGSRDPGLTTQEVEVARAVFELLAARAYNDPSVVRTALLAEVRQRLGVSKSSAKAFDTQAKALLRRLGRRGVISATPQRSGSSRDELTGSVRAAWQRGVAGQREVLDRLGQAFPPEEADQS